MSKHDQSINRPPTDFRIEPDDILDAIGLAANAGQRPAGAKGEKSQHVPAATTPSVSPFLKPAELSHDIDVITRFLGVFMTPGTVLELRAFRSRFHRGFVVPADSNMTLSGWYDNPNDLMVDATRARGTSMYVTVNPVDPDLLARSCNRLTKSTHATKDEDILSLRYAFVDIDPIRKADISSTDKELALAMAKRDLILAENPDLAACSLSGSSGNGAFILVRLDDLQPNRATHTGLVADFLAILSAKYSDDKVKIDQTTKNPSRVCCLPGTVKTKGSNVANRPWRLSSLDWVGSNLQ